MKRNQTVAELDIREELAYLSVDSNNISNPGTTAIADALAENTHVVKLDIGSFNLILNAY